MRFHDERDKRLHSMRHSQIPAKPPGNQRFAVHRSGTLAQSPIKRSRRSEVPLQDDDDDSLMVTVCYEAHLSMQQMLAVFAEMRGDDAEGPAR
jgi:hypothetical protein